MTHTIQLMARYARTVVNLTSCISIRLEKERYTPYTMLRGQWYCPPTMPFGEIMTLQSISE